MMRNYEHSRHPNYGGGAGGHGGYEDRRGPVGGYEERRGGGEDRGGRTKDTGFEVRREPGYEERRSVEYDNSKYRKRGYDTSSHSHSQVKNAASGTSEKNYPENSNQIRDMDLRAQDSSSYYNGRNDSFRERDAGTAYAYDKERRGGGHQNVSHPGNSTGHSRGNSSRSNRNAVPSGSNNSHPGPSKQFSSQAASVQSGYQGANGQKDSNGSAHRTSGGHTRGSGVFGDKDIVDPWSSWQRSKSGEPPVKTSRRDEGHDSGRGGAGSGGVGRGSGREKSRDRGRKRSLSKDIRRHDVPKRAPEREERDRDRKEKEREDQKRRDLKLKEQELKLQSDLRRKEERKLEEKRKAEEKRLQEIKRREEEIRREEEKLRKFEEERKREEQRRRDEERRRDESRRKPQPKRVSSPQRKITSRSENRSDPRSDPRHNSRSSPPKRVSPSRRISQRSPQKRQSPPRRQSPRRKSQPPRRQSPQRRSPAHPRRRPSTHHSRVSALARLGPKVPITARLGQGSRKTRRPVAKESPEDPEQGDANMQITISGGQGGGGRRVAREVDMENYTTVDEVGDVEVDKAEKEARDAKLNEMSEAEKEQYKERERKMKDRLLKEEERKRKLDEKLNVDLDKIVIKKRDKKNEDKSVDDKVLVVKKPNSMIGKLAEKRKELSLLATSATQKSDQEKTELRKKFKEKFLNEEKITEKVLNTALESVFYDEDQGYQLINMLLEEEEEEKQEDDIEQKDQIEVENGENDEKDEIDENGEGYEEECEDKSNVEDGVENEAAAVNSDDTTVDTAVYAHDELDFEAEEPEKTE